MLAAKRVAGRFPASGEKSDKAAVLGALTSFEFFDTLVESSLDEREAESTILDLARNLLSSPQ